MSMPTDPGDAKTSTGTKAIKRVSASKGELTPKGAVTKQRILDASITLIKEKGFSQVTLQDMCKAANVAPGTFYHYFTSHTDILIEILRVEGRELVAYHESLKSIPSPLERLNRLLGYQLAYFEKKGKEVVSHIYQLELSAPGSASASTFSIEEILPVKKLLEELLTEARAAGEFPPQKDPADTATLCIALLLYYSMQWIRSTNPRPLAEYVTPALTKLLS